MGKKTINISGVSNSVINTGVIHGSASNNISPVEQVEEQKTTSTSVHIERSRLHKIMCSLFNEGEIKTLCFDLKIDYEDFSGTGKEGVIRELIIFTERHNRYRDLVNYVSTARPHSKF